MDGASLSNVRDARVGRAALQWGAVAALLGDRRTCPARSSSVAATRRPRRRAGDRLRDVVVAMTSLCDVTKRMCVLALVSRAIDAVYTSLSAAGGKRPYT